MHNLEKLQQSFFKAVFDKSNSPNFIKSNYPDERLAIYRQTIFENMRNSLSITFPGSWKLLGEECANSVTYAFAKIEANLPSSGCLDDFGIKFPKFLANLKELEQLSYLEDYAYYEWLKHLAYKAESAPPIRVEVFSKLSKSLLDSIKFSFLPSVFLFSSKFPIEEIENMLSNPKPDAIQLSLTKSFGIISQLNNKVATLWITEDLWYFIKCLKDDLSLEQAVATLENQFSEFDLTNSIYFLLKHQLIAKIILKE